MSKNEYRVKEEFAYAGTRLIVVDSLLGACCDFCYFQSCGCIENGSGNTLHPICTADDRADKTNVIFKEIE